MLFDADEIRIITQNFSSFQIGSYTILKLKDAAKIKYLSKLKANPNNYSGNRFLVQIYPEGIRDDTVRTSLNGFNCYAVIDMRDQSSVHFIGASGDYALKGDMTRI